MSRCSRFSGPARTWERSGHDPSALPRGGQLAIVTDWATDQANRDSLAPLQREFIITAFKAERTRERAERGRTLRLRRLVAALTSLVAAVVALAGYAFAQRQDATTARNDAQSRAAAIEADQLRAQNLPLAAQLSVAAYTIAHTPEATASLLESSPRTVGCSRSPPPTARSGSGTSRLPAAR
jgi:hypothetical protein